MDADDRTARAYARLTGLRKRLEDGTGSMMGGGSVDWAYVEEFHEALEHLTACGFDIEEFKVRPEQMRRGPKASDPAVSGWRGADWRMFMAKLDAVIGYFVVATDRPRPQIDFRGQPL